MGWKQDSIVVAVHCCLRCRSLSPLAAYSGSSAAPHNVPCLIPWQTGRFHRHVPRRERYSRRRTRHHAVEDHPMQTLLCQRCLLLLLRARDTAVTCGSVALWPALPFLHVFSPTIVWTSASRTTLGQALARCCQCAHGMPPDLQLHHGGMCQRSDLV